MRCKFRFLTQVIHVIHRKFEDFNASRWSKQTVRAINNVRPSSDDCSTTGTVVCWPIPAQHKQWPLTTNKTSLQRNTIVFQIILIIRGVPSKIYPTPLPEKNSLRHYLVLLLYVAAACGLIWDKSDIDLRRKWLELLRMWLSRLVWRQ